MKKLDLNIKSLEKFTEQVEDGIDEKTKQPKFKVITIPNHDVAIHWISVMVERAINKPKLNQQTGRLMPTVEVGMQTQRTYGKMMDALEAQKDGIIEMEDDIFEFMDRKYHQAELSVSREVNRILISIDDAINKCKAEVKDGNTDSNVKRN